MSNNLLQRMVDGYGREEGKMRADILERGHSAAEQLARGIEPLHFVAVVVRGHGGEEETREGFVNGERRMQIDGVYGMHVIKLASRPYRWIGGDDWTIQNGGVRAVLANGVEVLMHGAGNVRQVIADGKVYHSPMHAACDITPAE